MPTVLVIDDQPLVRNTLQHILTIQGLVIVPAENGTAGLALFDTNPIDGALIDIHMPGKNGIDVCRELRAKAQQAGRALPVWMMTGACTPELKRLAAAAGAITIFEKPFNAMALGRELKAYFERTPVLSGTVVPEV